MRNRVTLWVVAVLITVCAAQVVAQAAPPASNRAANTTRVLPPPLDLPNGFRGAITSGTRTQTGAPGPRYWTQSARYRLTARLLPEQKRLEGSAVITYRNNSPDTLQNLHIDLTQNFHRGDAIRNESAEVTPGMELRRVVVDDQELRNNGQGARYQAYGTRMVILPPRPLLPGSSTQITIDWAFTIPQAGAGERMGWDADNLFFLAYWYPQMAVYDDVVGWHPDPFVGTTEFYADFASYDLTVDLPTGWVVMATGRLTNAAEVLAPTVLQRLQRAEQSDSVIHVITAQEFGAAATTAGTNGRLRWNFVSDSVRDVAISITRASLWDAARTSVGDRDGDGRNDYTRVDAFYRQNAPRWRNSARYSQHAIRFLSGYLGIPYPWPHMTAVEAGGIIGGGMEYPMMTLIGDYNAATDSALYNVTAHEEAHMWFPMLISSDERRYSWMDEGTTTFNENQARNDFFPGLKHELPDQNQYIQAALSDEEGEIMRRAQFHYSGLAYGIATYAKPATMLAALRGVLGTEVFHRALKEYGQRWKYKHPYPWDMWHTFESVSGTNLDWFWSSWYETTWTLDQAVTNVATSGGNTTITIEDRGRVPMPVHLVITRGSGQSERRVVPVDVWLAGASSTTVSVAGADVTRVEIDAERNFPDVNRRNNTWTR
ncbi:MAG: M1 family metallopeptidase [Longimicrobiales bacterium]